MTHADLQNLLHEVRWLKATHPDKVNLIAFVERFVCFVREAGRPETAVCPGCGGRGFWYSEDNGQVVTCSCTKVAG